MEDENRSVQHQPSMDPETIVAGDGQREIDRLEGGRVASSIDQGRQENTGGLEAASKSTGCRSYGSNQQNPALLGAEVVTSLTFKER